MNVIAKSSLTSEQQLFLREIKARETIIDSSFVADLSHKFYRPKTQYLADETKTFACSGFAFTADLESLGGIPELNPFFTYGLNRLYEQTLGESALLKAESFFSEDFGKDYTNKSDFQELSENYSEVTNSSLDDFIPLQADDFDYRLGALSVNVALTMMQKY